jgi:hypothetical protein
MEEKIPEKIPFRYNTVITVDFNGCNKYCNFYTDVASVNIFIPLGIAGFIIF